MGTRSNRQFNGRKNERQKITRQQWRNKKTYILSGRNQTQRKNGGKRKNYRKLRKYQKEKNIKKKV